MDKVKYKILVISGKGGVGKTTVAINLAFVLSKKGFKVGLLDVDIHGPNVPKMLGLEDMAMESKNNKMIPINTGEGIKVISMAFLLKKQDAAIWRGPMKHKVIQQFVEKVDWGPLDYLIIDAPPGTGDEVLSASQILKPITGSVIVSMPQKISLLDAGRSIDFSNKLEIPIIGLIENMSGDLFGKGRVEAFSDEEGITFLGSLELDKAITKANDEGIPFTKTNSKNTSSFNKITDKIVDYCEV